MGFVITGPGPGQYLIRSVGASSPFSAEMIGNPLWIGVGGPGQPN